MNKLFLAMVLPVVALAILSGCNPKDSNDPDNKGIDTAMTANQQKQYLFDVANELIGTFQTDDQKDAITLAGELYWKYENYNWEQIEEDIENEFTKGKYQGLFSLPQRLAETAAGQRMPAVTNATYIFSFAGDSKIFTFNESTKTVDIKKGDGKSIQVLFKDHKGQPCELKIWGEGETTEYTYTYKQEEWVCTEYYTDEYGSSWCQDGSYQVTGTKTIKVQLPKQIKLTLRQADNTLIALTLNVETKKNDHLYLSYDLQVINMNVTFDAKINSTNANCAFAYKYGDKTLLAATANLPQFKLIDKQDDQEWEEWIELYYDRYEKLLGQVGSGTAKLDILDKVQIVATVNSTSDLYDEYLRWNKKYDQYDYYDYERTYTHKQSDGDKCQHTYTAWWDHPYNSLQAQRDLIQIYDQYCKAAVYYGGQAEQAMLKLQPQEYKDNYNIYCYDYDRYNDYSYQLITSIPYSYYATEPVFYFPKDDTSYAFEDYFTSSKFQALPQMAQDLINAYIKLLNNYFDIDNVDFAD